MKNTICWEDICHFFVLYDFSCVLIGLHSFTLAPVYLLFNRKVRFTGIIPLFTPPLALKFTKTRSQFFTRALKLDLLHLHYLQTTRQPLLLSSPMTYFAPSEEACCSSDMQRRTLNPPAYGLPDSCSLCLWHSVPRKRHFQNLPPYLTLLSSLSSSTCLILFTLSLIHWSFRNNIVLALGEVGTYCWLSKVARSSRMKFIWTMLSQEYFCSLWKKISLNSMNDYTKQKLPPSIKENVASLFKAWYYSEWNVYLHS